jgi:hypothetical protein
VAFKYCDIGSWFMVCFSTIHIAYISKQRINKLTTDNGDSRYSRLEEKQLEISSLFALFTFFVYWRVEAKGRVPKPERMHQRPESEPSMSAMASLRRVRDWVDAVVIREGRSNVDEVQTNTNRRWV